MKFFIGIDNSLSGAVAIVDAKGKPMGHMHLSEIEKDEVDEKAVIEFLLDYGCVESNSIAALERPHNFCMGKNAARIMWYCYGKLKACMKWNGYITYFPLSSTWQFDMLGSFPKGDSKKFAEKKVLELYGKPFEKTKKLSGGINDAYLIAEWLRREYLRTTAK